MKKVKTHFKTTTADTTTAEYKKTFPLYFKNILKKSLLTNKTK
jgi:hypothetical protein